MEGTVKFFNTTKGFGFIKSNEDNKEYFVHVTSVLNQAELGEGDKVKFEVENDQRGQKAVNVSLIEG